MEKELTCPVCGALFLGCYRGSLCKPCRSVRESSRKRGSYNTKLVRAAQHETQRATENQQQLAALSKAARAAGLSYGQFVARGMMREKNEQGEI